MYTSAIASGRGIARASRLTGPANATATKAAMTIQVIGCQRTQISAIVPITTSTVRTIRSTTRVESSSLARCETGVGRPSPAGCAGIVVTVNFFSTLRRLSLLLSACDRPQLRLGGRGKKPLVRATYSS